MECLQGNKTIHQALIDVASYLESQHISEAKENTERLFLHMTNWNRAQLLMNRMDVFQEEWKAPFAELIVRKAKGEPIQYIFGEQYFYGRRFVVNEHVLIPRPETELLVEAVIHQVKQLGEQKPVTIVDVGTGSGAIAITLKAELPFAHVIASDISRDALQVAKQNAEQLAVDVTFVEGDLLQPFVNGDEYLMFDHKKIDIVVSNPPYIPDSENGSLQIEVQKYEPHLALFGGVDGLNPYKAMFGVIKNLLHPPTIVAFELGIHQPDIVASWMEESQLWSEVSIITDYNGIKRHIIATKN